MIDKSGIRTSHSFLTQLETDAESLFQDLLPSYDAQSSLYREEYEFYEQDEAHEILADFSKDPINPRVRSSKP